MTEDRELLELAAKAAGLTTRWGAGHQSDMMFVEVAKPEGWVTGREWNPLKDDGDALRLAVALRLDIDFDPAGEIVCSQYSTDNSSARCERLGSDDLAATRRAITRAAAEIQRAREASK